MFCKNCGQKSDGMKKFCTNCGSVLSNVQSSGLKSGEPILSSSAPKESWSKGRIAKTVGTVVVVGGIVLIKMAFGAVNSADNVAVDTNNDAITSFDSGDSELAIQQLQEASEGALTQDTKISTLKNLAYVYASEGNYDLAISKFREAFALTSTGSFDYYLISGEIALLENKPNSALIAYNKAYDINPNEFQVVNALALFYMDLEEIAPQYTDYKKALVYAQKAYDLSKLETSKENLAIAHFFNENYDQTISMLISSDFTNKPYSAIWVGLSYASKSDSKNAKKYFQIAINNGADIPPEVYDYMASN